MPRERKVLAVMVAATITTWRARWKKRLSVVRAVESTAMANASSMGRITLCVWQASSATVGQISP